MPPYPASTSTSTTPPPRSPYPVAPTPKSGWKPERLVLKSRWAAAKEILLTGPAVVVGRGCAPEEVTPQSEAWTSLCERVGVDPRTTAYVAVLAKDGTKRTVVSTFHVLIRRDPETRKVVVVDLSSRNGVFLNGERLVPYVAYRMTPTSLLQLCSNEDQAVQWQFIPSSVRLGPEFQAALPPFHPTEPAVDDSVVYRDAEPPSLVGPRPWKVDYLPGQNTPWPEETVTRASVVAAQAQAQAQAQAAAAAAATTTTATTKSGGSEGRTSPISVVTVEDERASVRGVDKAPAPQPFVPDVPKPTAARAQEPPLPPAPAAATTNPEPEQSRKRARTSSVGSGGGGAVPRPRPVVVDITPADLIAKALEFLSCGACGELLRNAAVLPCGHAFCRGCLAVRKQPSPEVPPVCPLCGSEATATAAAAAAASSFHVGASGFALMRCRALDDLASLIDVASKTRSLVNAETAGRSASRVGPKGDATSGGGPAR